MLRILVFLLTSTLVQAAAPNLVLIVADDLGYGDLGCYGGQEIRTPNIDRLARDGVRFTQAYSAAPVCSPTRAALMTGRYPQKAGFDWVIRYTEKDRGLPPDNSVLAKNLKAAGYSTALFGKWHLGYPEKFGPNAHGFDRFFGFLAADLDFVSHTDALGDEGLYENTKLVKADGYLTDLITDRSVEFIAKSASPFLLEVCYNAPHWPFQKPGDAARTKATYGPETGTRADYVKMVERLDEGVGRILKALDDRQLSENTLVIFVSDNGGERLSDNGALFHGKYTLWEGGIRVPCILKWNGKFAAGTVREQPTITMDLTATILAAAGVPAKLDGIDLRAESKDERTFCWRLPRPNAQFGQKAVRHGNWKYVVDRDSELLFDLAKDVSERTNLAYKHPEVVTDLKKRLADWEATLPE